MSWLNVFTNCAIKMAKYSFVTHSKYIMSNPQCTQHFQFKIFVIWFGRGLKGVRLDFDGKRLEVGLMDKVTEKCCPVAPDLQFYDSYIRLRPSITNGPLSKEFISILLLERGSNGCSDRKVLPTSPRLSVLRFLNDYDKGFVVHTCPGVQLRFWPRSLGKDFSKSA